MNQADFTLQSRLTTQQSNIGLILLAAGASLRMKKRPKQLLEFRGKTLLRRAAETALDTCCYPVCVVLGANAEKLRTQVADLPIVIADNKNWTDGMASSLQIGMEKLLEIAPGISAVCIMLADQPLINSETIKRLIETFEFGENPVMACGYAETIGVPAILARSLFDEVMNLEGDSGAKTIIQKYTDAAGILSVPEAAIDIDSQQDYELLTSMGKKRK